MSRRKENHAKQHIVGRFLSGGGWYRRLAGTGANRARDLYLGYGYDATGGAHLLNLNLSGSGSECPDCDRFRIDFDGSDSELSYLMQVYDSNGNIATLNGAESLAGRILPFHVDFPFADFVQSSAQPIDWNHIDFIVVLFQTGSYLGGHDFAVTKITAVPAPPADAVD